MARQRRRKSGFELAIELAIEGGRLVGRGINRLISREARIERLKKGVRSAQKRRELEALRLQQEEEIRDLKRERREALCAERLRRRERICVFADENESDKSPSAKSL